MKIHPHRAAGARFIAIGTLGVVAFTLAGCSGGGDAASTDSSGKVTISVAIQTEEGENQPYVSTIEAFEAANPDISVDIVQIPNADLANVIRTQLQGGNAPDVFYGSPGSGNSNSLLPLGASGYLLDLSGEDWATSAVPESAHDLYFSGDAQYALPLDLVPIPWLINTDTADTSGVTIPDTFSGLLDACATANAAGTPLVQLAGAVPNNAGLMALELAANFVYSENPDWNTDRADGKVTFADSQGWQDTLNALLDMNKAGCFQTGAAGATFDDLFSSVANGTSVSMVGPGSVVGTIKSLADNVNITPTALPAEKAADTFMFASPSNAFGANAATKNPDAVMKFLEYFSEPSTQDAFAKVQVNASLQVALTGATDVPGYENIAPYLSDPEKNAPLANLFWPNGEVYTNLGTGVQGLLTGQATVDQVLQAMDSAWT